MQSSKEFFVKTSGLRWVSMQLLVPVPWTARVWALPLLTVLAPSERYHHERGVRHKKLTDWDAALYDPAPQREARTVGRSRRKGQR